MVDQAAVGSDDRSAPSYRVKAELGEPIANSGVLLVRLLARGSAGYRTAAKALQYALQHPVVTIESISNPDPTGLCIARLRVDGRLRDTGARFDAQWLVKLLCKDDTLTSADIVCPEEDLQRIAKARRGEGASPPRG